MKKGQLVKVYDGDLIGFTTATLIEPFETLKNGEEIFERWSMETKDGTRLVRFVRNNSDAEKDGCGYILEEKEKSCNE